MLTLIRFVSIIAGALLFFDGLHAIDLATWGLGNDLKENIDLALKGKDLLGEVGDLFVGSAEGGNRIAIEAAATLPGIVVSLLRGIAGLAKFVVSAAVIAVAFGFIFTVAAKNEDSIEAFRADMQQSVALNQPAFAVQALFSRIGGSFRSMPPLLPRPIVPTSPPRTWLPQPRPPLCSPPIHCR
jgi:hypothetical protein